MSPRAKFRANIRNNKRAMGDKLNSIVSDLASLL